MKTKNPFVTIGYQGSEYFCDRELETKKMLDYLKKWMEYHPFFTS